MRSINALQLGHHRSVIRMILRGRERAAAQTPAESFPIQSLVVRQIPRGESIPSKEAADILAFRVSILDALVVNAKALKQAFVFPRELRLFHAAVIPENHDPSTRFKDAGKFASGGLGFEPVKSLGGGDEIDSRVAKRGGFGGGSDADEVLKIAQEFLAGLAHFGVWFDAEDAVAVFKEEFAEDACAGADVGDDMVGAQAAIRAQKIQHGRGVAGAIADVIRDAIGEALFGVGERHWRKFSVLSFQWSVRQNPGRAKARPLQLLPTGTGEGSGRRSGKRPGYRRCRT